MKEKNNALWIIVGIAIGIVLTMIAMLAYKKYVDNDLNNNKIEDKEEIKESDKESEEVKEKIKVYLFLGNGCDYCEAAKTFFLSIEKDYGKYYEMVSYEVWSDKNNQELMQNVADYMGDEVKGVPYIVIGDKTFDGYNSSYDEDIKKAINDAYEDEDYVDFVAKVRDEDNINQSNKVLTEITGTPLKEIEIPDEEIRELYDSIKAADRGDDICLMNYYIAPFDKNNPENLIDIIINSYAIGYYKEEITEELLNKLPADEKNIIVNSMFEYVDGEIIREGLKKWFNNEIIDFSNYNTSLDYIEEADIFANYPGGGGMAYEADMLTQIIGYRKEGDDVYITEIKAEIDEENNVFRFHKVEKTKVYQNINNFEFTDLNKHLFPQIEYHFKKNNKGKYYVYDIINLNYSNDGEDYCF